MEILYSEQYQRLRSALAVDMLRFDHELMTIAQVIQEGAECAADAARARDEAKHQRDIEIASASAVLRSTADERGKYPSETQIGSEIALVDAVQDAKQALILAESDADKWRALVDALKNKKEVLRTLSDQIVAGFMSPNSFTCDTRAEMSAQRRPITKRGGE